MIQDVALIHVIDPTCIFEEPVASQEDVLFYRPKRMLTREFTNCPLLSTDGIVGEICDVIQIDDDARQII